MQLLQSLGLFNTQKCTWEIRPPQNSGQFFTVPWVSLILRFHCSSFSIKLHICFSVAKRIHLYISIYYSIGEESLGCHALIFDAHSHSLNLYTCSTNQASICHLSSVFIVPGNSMCGNFFDNYCIAENH